MRKSRKSADFALEITDFAQKIIFAQARRQISLKVFHKHNRDFSENAVKITTPKVEEPSKIGKNCVFVVKKVVFCGQNYATTLKGEMPILAKNTFLTESYVFCVWRQISWLFLIFSASLGLFFKSIRAAQKLKPVAKNYSSVFLSS